MRSDFSRRKFIESISMGMGASIMSTGVSPQEIPKSAFSPRLISIGTVSIMDLEADSTKDMVEKVLRIMEEIIPYHPDIICLPEIFAYCNIPGLKYELKDVAEKVPGNVVTPFLQFAAKHKCYVICPTYTLHNGHVFISAVLISRSGRVEGEYRKMRPAESELQMGIKPGEPDPPVFETDFGKIGMQICFDLKYDDGWNKLKNNGAQIIFWPSAYAGGQEISSRAWRHQVYIVTSTQKDTSKVCDITGETLVQTNRWQRNWASTTINLEKAFIHTWPAVSVFPDIRKKYGERIKINTYSEEEWSIMESLDAGLKINDVLREYNLKTMTDFLKGLSEEHEKKR